MSQSIYRYVPENHPEKIMMLQSMAYCLWRDFHGKKLIRVTTGLPAMQMRFTCQEKGCMALLVLSPEDGWDEEGRLQSTVEVSHALDNFACSSSETYPIYFSMISSGVTDKTDSKLRLLWEFPANPYNREDIDSEMYTVSLPHLVMSPDGLHNKAFPAHHPNDSHHDVGPWERGGFHEDDMRNHFPDVETYQNWIESSD